MIMTINSSLSLFIYLTQAHPNPSGNWSEWVLSKLRLPNCMAEEVPNKPLDYYTCPFKANKIDK
jgi:anoctamin-7